MLGALSITAGSGLSQNENRNYVSQNDPELTITDKFNNPMRYMYFVGVGVGGEYSQQPGIFAQANAFFAPKHFLIQAKYQKDLMANIIGDKYNGKLKPYNEFEFKLAINFKDKIIEKNIYPSVGIEILSQSSETVGSYIKTTTTFRDYYTDYITKTRNTSGLNLGIKIGTRSLYYDTAKANINKKTVSFEDDITAPPGNFAVPFNYVTLSVGYSMATFSSYKVHYKYRTFRKQKHKGIGVTITNIDLLFSPILSASDNAYYLMSENDPNVYESKIKSIKKNLFGFNLSSTMNIYGGKPCIYQRADLGISPGIYYSPDFLEDEELNAFSKFLKPAIYAPWYMRYTIGIAL
ncbi:MAG: hypothetical protein J5I91_06155 [Bacteroidetes bacterium]|nr:hypothetical protein [Bacteroidota bacterium]